MKLFAPSARRSIQPLPDWILCVALIAALAFPLTLVPPTARAQSAFRRVESFQLKPDGQVKVENLLGATRVEVWEGPTVRLIADKQGGALAASELVLMGASNSLLIQCRPAGQGGRIDLTLYVPALSHLQVTGGSGTVEISGPLASAVVDTSSGHILYNIPKSDDARLALHSARGTVRAKFPLTVTESAGPRNLHGRLGKGTAPIILSSQAGNITLGAALNSVPVARVTDEPKRGQSTDADEPGQANPGVARPGRQAGLGASHRGANPPGGTPDEEPIRWEEPAPSGSAPNRQPGANGPVKRSGGSGPAIFAGNKQSDDELFYEQVGPLSRPRRERRTSAGDAGLSVRIIPADTALGGTPQNNRDDFELEAEEETASGTRGGGRTSRNSQTTTGGVTSNRPPLARQPTRKDNNPYALSPWPTDDEPAAAEPPPSRAGRPPTLTREREADNPADKPAAAPGEADEDAIKLEAALVNLNVSVTDRAGLALAGLKAEDFEVFENSQKQPVEFFQSTQSPFNVVLLLDLSGSIQDKLSLIKSAALKFLDMIGPQDKVAVVTFTHEVRAISKLTSDREVLRDAIKSIKKTDGGTAFYEAMWLSMVEYLRGTQGQRNAIVVLSDGVDSSLDRYYPAHTRVTFPQLARRLEESDVIVFPIYVDTEYEEVFERQTGTSEAYTVARMQLEKLSEVSGGQMFEARQLRDLAGVYKQVADALRTVYSIGYYPANAARDGTYRRVRVKVNRPDAAVRSRRGYYAN